MKKIEFRATVEVPDDASDEDIQEWIEFELHARGYLRGTNEMAHMDMRCDEVMVLS